MESRKTSPLAQDAAQPASRTQPNLRPVVVHRSGRGRVGLGRSLTCVCIREGVRPQALLEAAVTMALEDPEFFNKVRELEKAEAMERRARRLRTRTIYRHRKIL